MTLIPPQGDDQIELLSWVNFIRKHFNLPPVFGFVQGNRRFFGHDAVSRTVRQGSLDINGDLVKKDTEEENCSMWVETIVPEVSIRLVVGFSEQPITIVFENPTRIQEIFDVLDDTDNDTDHLNLFE